MTTRRPELKPDYTTVADLRAALDARKPFALAIAAAFRAGDIEATAKAQAAMLEAFPL